MLKRRTAELRQKSGKEVNAIWRRVLNSTTRTRLVRGWHHLRWGHFRENNARLGRSLTDTRMFQMCTPNCWPDSGLQPIHSDGSQWPLSPQWLRVPQCQRFNGPTLAIGSSHLRLVTLQNFDPATGVFVVCLEIPSTGSEACNIVVAPLA